MKPIVKEDFKPYGEVEFILELYPLVDILNLPTSIDSNYQCWFNNPDITKYNSHGVFPFSPLNNVDNYLRDKSRIVWGIVVQDSSANNKYRQHIGNISLQQINLIDRNAEVSCIIGEVDYWSKGIMTWALKHLIQHSYQSLGLNRIWAGTAKINIGMIKVFQKIGFAIEGEYKESMYLNGRYESVIAFGLLRSTWEGRTEPEPLNKIIKAKDLDMTAFKDTQQGKIKEGVFNMSQPECTLGGTIPISPTFHQDNPTKKIIIEEPPKPTPIDKIEEIRTKNNHSWMDLLRLAIESNPEKAETILKDIVTHDEQVVNELKKMLNKE